jgi:hypothetical protein
MLYNVDQEHVLDGIFAAHGGHPVKLDGSKNRWELAA